MSTAEIANEYSWTTTPVREGPLTATWKSIETAPKDGTAILLYSPDAREPGIFIGIYAEVEMEPEGEWYEYWREDGCWPIDVEVTHWMPLPDIPKH